MEEKKDKSGSKKCKKQTFLFEEFAKIFVGELGNVILDELLERFVEDGLANGYANVQVSSTL